RGRPRVRRPPSEWTRLDRWWLRFSSSRWRPWWDRAAPILILALAAFTRLWRLGEPHSLVFDETYYVKDSWTLMHLGYEASWPQNADVQFNAGSVNGYAAGNPEFVAHPPFGKWLISVGLAVFGAQNSVGWRISTAVLGILAVALVYVIAHRMFHSTLIASVAGLLMAVDGTAIVMSRVALLDNSVMFLALLAFWFVLIDRGWAARRLERALVGRAGHGRSEPSMAGPEGARAAPAPRYGPALWWRPWLLAAAAAVGLASGTKWTGLYFLAFFACYVVVVDMAARRRHGLRHWLSGAVAKQGPVTFLVMVPLALATYIATWAGWIATSGGYYRHWAQAVGGAWQGTLAWVPLWFQNLWHYQVAMYDYSINLHVPHPYESGPLRWLFLWRPTSMYYVQTAHGQAGCPAVQCAREITELGNPFIWWVGTACMAYLVYRLVRYRSWRAGAILTGFGAGYLPWLLYINRTIFEFYTIAYEPYMILGIAAVAAIVIGRPADPPRRRRIGLRLVAGYLGIVCAASIFFWPIWVAARIPLWYWNLHMWLPSWR
ncbi:MAG TPA: phospholipid carrier-dependent glycosyltransferase, partial [Microbacteriaceae bacterium]|nr:phospholipid carrier-dependent glycosyltransferase [Microbacteriaceae bacterium]